MKKEGIVHTKTTKSDKMNIIQQTAQAFYTEYSDVTPSVIIDIFKTNLITHSFTATVTDYSYI